MSTDARLGITAIVLAAYSLVATFVDIQLRQRITAVEARLADLERNWRLDDALLSRAEEVIGRIERRQAEPTNIWTHGTIKLNGVEFTNIVVVQDAFGNWTVSWPTNRKEGP